MYQGFLVPKASTSKYGYALGGKSDTGGLTTTRADRITFSTGVTAVNTASSLSLTRYGAAGISDGSTYGYALGGATGGVSGYDETTRADRLTFSSGVTAQNTASKLSYARSSLSGISDGSVYGYALGGEFTGGFTALADRLTFSSGVTAANTVSNLSSNRSSVAGLSDGSTYGYASGGSNYTYATNRLTFSTGVTATNTVSALSTGRSGAAGISDGSTYGYVLGGYTGGAGPGVYADRLTFSTGVTAQNTASRLSVGRYYLPGLSDGTKYGYALGGYSSDYSAVTDRLTFSTGATAANTASNLSLARHSAAGFSDNMA
ncbi:hypothetical protein UFOVP127_15 [uncultured Caudovirales phage]|uniref:Uncharacterized protein n=1 Tax=uncultured Caudovirales phage TaxID=2100421 RepID=A0A6J5LGB5_9CAUD|nr:hypothetical protein UFOVP127_15 [uncultured Caudovirales phage]